MPEMNLTPLEASALDLLIAAREDPRTANTEMVAKAEEIIVVIVNYHWNLTGGGVHIHDLPPVTGLTELHAKELNANASGAKGITSMSLEQLKELRGKVLVKGR